MADPHPPAGGRGVAALQDLLRECLAAPAGEGSWRELAGRTPAIARPGRDTGGACWLCQVQVAGGPPWTLVSLLSQLCGNQTKKLWKAILLCIVRELAGGGFEAVAVSVSDM